MIIGLVGEKLAGKDTVANYLVEKYEASHFRFTHILDEILETLNLPISRQNEIDLGLGLRKVFGEHVLVDALGKRAKEAWTSLIVVNGIRMDEMEVVKQWPDAIIVYVTAPLQIRFDRYQKRREKADDAQLNFEQFTKAEQGPTEARIPELGSKADYRIDNVGSLEELYKKFDDLIKNLSKSHGHT